jgi:tripartite-type tricarboxylate transporter receptor subunit TctC
VQPSALLDERAGTNEAGRRDRRRGGTMRLPSLRRLVPLLALVLAVVPGAGRAQDWPARPVTMVVPFPAGGNADIIARATAQALGEALGRQFVVDNRAGAGGNIGGAVVAKAAPDGYTLFFTTPAPVVLNKYIYKSLPYDPDRDFTPVALVAKSPLIVAMRPGFPAKTMAEMIAYAKANPGKINVGHPGNGTLGHITSELIQQSADVKLTNVPYRGSAPLMTDLLAGQIDLAMDFMPTYVPLVEDRKVGALAVTTARRTAQLPDTPTVQEGGVKGFEATAWYAIVAPAGTPAAIVDTVNRTVNAFLASEKGRTTLERNTMQPGGGTPADLKAFMASETAKWRPVIEAAKIEM